MAKSFSRPRILPQRGGLRLSDQQRKAATIWYNWYAGGGGGPQRNPRWWSAVGLVHESVDYTLDDPLAAESLEDSLINLANRGVPDESVGVDPTHAQGSGWKFKRSTHYHQTSMPAVEVQAVVIRVH